MSSIRSRTDGAHITAAAMAMVLCASVAMAQTTSGVEYRNDFFIDNVSVYGDYYSSGIQQVGGAVDSGQLSGDGAYGGQATLGLRQTRERSSFGLSYTPSYIGRVRYTDWNAANHLLDISFERSLNTRFRLGLSLSGNLNTTQSFAFSPTRLSSLASSPGTAASLADILGDRATAPIQAGSLAGMPDADSSARFALFGDRVFASSAQAHLSYNISPRLTFSLSGSVGRTQGVPTDHSSGVVFPLVMTEMGAVALSYALSPRTHISVSAQSTRVHSARSLEYLTASTTSIERMVSRRWFVTATGGIGTVISDLRAANSGTPLQYTAGGGLGFRAYTQTVLVSYDRQIGSVYGLGATASDSLAGAWRWTRPGVPWWVSVSGTRFKAIDSLVQIDNWRANAEVGRFLSRTIALSMQYAFLSNSYPLNIASTPIRVSAARVSLLWQPRGGRMQEAQDSAPGGAGEQEPQSEQR